MRAFVIVIMSVLVSSLGFAATPATSEIGSADVLALLSRMAISDATEIKMPRICHRTGFGSMQIMKANRIGDRVDARIVCNPRSTCQEFVAQIRFPSAGAAADAAQKLSGPVQKTASLHGRPLLRAGAPMQLHFAQNGMDLSIKVRSLESARAGQSVRMRDEKTGKIYRATVNENGEATGEL